MHGYDRTTPGGWSQQITHLPAGIWPAFVDSCLCLSTNSSKTPRICSTSMPQLVCLSWTRHCHWNMYAPLHGLVQLHAVTRKHACDNTPVALVCCGLFANRVGTMTKRALLVGCNYPGSKWVTQGGSCMQQMCLKVPSVPETGPTQLCCTAMRTALIHCMQQTCLQVPLVPETGPTKLWCCTAMHTALVDCMTSQDYLQVPSPPENRSHQTGCCCTAMRTALQTHCMTSQVTLEVPSVQVTCPPHCAGPVQYHTHTASKSAPAKQCSLHSFVA